MRPPRYMPQTAQPNQMYPAMYQYMGQTQGQGYPGTSVMVQQQGQIMYQPSQRMATPQYLQNTQIKKIAATAAQYPNQATQQYGSTPQYQTVYYQPGGQVPIAQPPRPPSGSGMVTGPTGGTLPKRERKPIPIIDPNSGQQVQTETESKTTPPSGSARSTPVGRQVSERSPPPQSQQHSTQDIAAQFAAQIAATLKPNHSAHTEEVSAPDSLPQTEFTDETGALPPEFVPESHSVEASSSEEPVSDMSVNAQVESAVDEPQQVPVHEPSIPETTTQQETTVEAEPFTKPPDTVSGTSDDSDIQIWSETLNAKAKASGNVKRQEGEVQPTTKSCSDVDHADLSEEKKKTKVVTAEELSKDVNDLVLLLKPAQVLHDMNKKQPAAAGLMPAPSVAPPQQQGLFQQQQAGLRTQSFYQPQGMRPPRYMPQTAQPNQMYPAMYQYMGQTQGQGYPGTSVMVQQQGQIMNEEPVCSICRTVFKHTGPVPYLLPCLHAVCETCVTTSVNGDISCSTCGIHVDTRKRNLCPDVITQRRVLDLTIKQRQTDILCTLEDDGNQAVFWCQECEEFLCEHCQNVHQSFKVTRRHSIQEITSALCNTVCKVEYCSVHKIYPLDTWDKTCKILICFRCCRDLHAEHDVEDVEVAEEELKSEIETQLLRMKSVESNFERISRKMEQQIRHSEDAGEVQKEHLKQTFQSLRQFLDQREKEVLVKLDQLTSRITQEAKQQKQATELKQKESKRTTEYIALAISYPDHRALFPLKPIITERTESCRLTGIDVVDRKFTIPHINSQKLEPLKSLISNFSDVESLERNDIEEPKSAGNSINAGKKPGLEGKKNLRDLSQKVDEEEGTDMDAFLDGKVDVKLHQSENALKPGRIRDDKKDVAETQIEELYLKLTPQKFQTLIKQGTVIDTETRLKRVTDIIFEKAISEPSFSVACANMCRYLLTIKVPSDTKQGESVNFRVILLTRFQREFEKDKDIQLDLDRRKKAIEEAGSEKKAEMKKELETLIANARRRYIGNITFRCELFKLKMLTETHMHDCVFKLLRSRDEENLECLCRLLTTIGKELESEKAKPRMDQYFQQMRKIVTEKKVSSRCHFMLQDVIDLRDNNWKLHRDENNP